MSLLPFKPCNINIKNMMSPCPILRSEISQDLDLIPQINLQEFLRSKFHFISEFFFIKFRAAQAKIVMSVHLLYWSWKSKRRLFAIYTLVSTELHTWVISMLPDSCLYILGQNTRREGCGSQSFVSAKNDRVEAIRAIWKRSKNFGVFEPSWNTTVSLSDSWKQVLSSLDIIKNDTVSDAQIWFWASQAFSKSYSSKACLFGQLYMVIRKWNTLCFPGKKA